jgi:hypothetical protein
MHRDYEARSRQHHLVASQHRTRHPVFAPCAKLDVMESTWPQHLQSMWELHLLYGLHLTDLRSYSRESSKIAYRKAARIVS